MTVLLRIAVVAGGDLDRALCSLPEVVLLRRDGAIFVQHAAELGETAQRHLARAGARATPIPAPPPHGPSLRPAVMPDLAPLDVAGVIDTVTVRVLATGDAARLPKVGLFRRRTPDVARVRAVLRGEDRVFAWRRIVWADRDALRSRALGRARPIVFDRDAVAHGPERRAYASAGALARWIGR